MPRWPSAIMSPVHVHGVNSAADYMRLQQQVMTKNQRAYPGLEWGKPARVSTPIAVFVSNGKWLVECPRECGNCPCASPEWGIACCFDCGSIYDNLTWPDDPDAVQAELVKRSSPFQRYWAPGVTVEDLRGQTFALANPDFVAALVESDIASKGGA